MTLNQLTYFYHAATLQHFNQAAEAANISEPSLSRSIASLENELGIVLFEKKGRNVQLTKAGEIFLDHVRSILSEVERTETKMHQFAESGGHIDLAYVSPLAASYIPKTVRSFLRETKNHNVTFGFYQDITKNNLAGLKNGTYDIIFGSYVENEPTVEFVQILKQEMVVILPKDHQLGEREYLDSSIFSMYPVLSYDRTSGLGQYTRSFFAQNQIKPDYMCESPDETGIAALVAEGFGIALVADVDSIHRDDILIKHLIPEERFYHNVYMSYMKGRYHLPAVDRLIQYILVQALKTGNA